MLPQPAFSQQTQLDQDIAQLAADAQQYEALKIQSASLATQLAATNGSLATSGAAVQSDLAAVTADITASMQAACPTCAKGADQTDLADLTEAVARGFGHRLAIGPYREATLAVRAWRGEAASSGETDGGFARLRSRLDRTPRFTPCQKATMALIALEMVNSFSPGTIPPSVIAIAVQLQAAACGTPVPPTPVPVPTPGTPHLAPPAVIDLPVAKHATGLVLTPLPVRQAEHVKDAIRNRAFHSKHGAVTLPASLDLRGTLETPVEDQGQCGSCHDFSGVGIIESANIKAGNLTAAQACQLSEQFLLDTNPNYDGGCSGGDANSIFQWCTQQGGGVPLTSVYGPYRAGSQGGNQLSTTAVGYTISDWGYADTVTGVASVKAVKEALVTYGPVSVCIGCPRAFMGYSGGVITYDLSSGIDHQIIISGYVDDATVPGGGYWIVRNSWGTGWGENGYFRASYASQPTTEAMYAVAKPGQTVVVPAGSAPTPDTPTHRASVLLEKGARLNKTQPQTVLRALKAAETILQDAP